MTDFNKHKALKNLRVFWPLTQLTAAHGTHCTVKVACRPLGNPTRDLQLLETLQCQQVMHDTLYDTGL